VDGAIASAACRPSLRASGRPPSVTRKPNRHERQRGEPNPRPVHGAMHRRERGELPMVNRSLLGPRTDSPWLLRARTGGPSCATIPVVVVLLLDANAVFAVQVPNTEAPIAAAIADIVTVEATTIGVAAKGIAVRGVASVGPGGVRVRAPAGRGGRGSASACTR